MRGVGGGGGEWGKEYKHLNSDGTLPGKRLYVFPFRHLVGGAVGHEDGHSIMLLIL